MKPHEKIEIIITTVCSYYKVKWQDVMRCKYNVHNDDIRYSKHLIRHLLYIHLSEDVAAEITKCDVSNIRNSSKVVEMKLNHENKELGQIILTKIGA